MTEQEETDFGPLAALIGTWTGNKGADLSPEPDGTEDNPYFETITYTPVGTVSNAEEQDLAAIHYHQIASRVSDGKPFHNETGYWLWDAATGTVMHSLAIPRAVSVLAGGSWNGETDSEGRIILEVAAAIDNPDWSIIQSPFMQEKARTLSFSQTFLIGDNSLIYEQTTLLDIYGRQFDHTDRSELSQR